MHTVKKNTKKETPVKYIKKNHISSSKKLIQNIYNPTSLNIINTLPILSQDNFVEIFNEFNSENQSEKSFTQKIEILDDGSVCKKNTKHTTRKPSPLFGERYFELDNNTNNNLLLSENIIKNNNEINDENYYQTFDMKNELNNIINEEIKYNSGMKYNKSLPNLKTYTYSKHKVNFTRNKNNEIYIKHKPFNSTGKNKINIKNTNSQINYRRNLFDKNKIDNDESDIINQWKYLSNKSIINYNKKILKSNIQIIIQNLKIKQILKNKEKLPTNLIHIINPPSENSDLQNKIFFDFVEKNVEKDDKINKYKGSIESINEVINESLDDDENKRSSIRSNKNKQIKINKKINELEIKDIESINFSPVSAKSKDIKLILNKNIQEKNLNKNNNDIFFIYKAEIDDKKRIKLVFNENKENIDNKFNIKIKSYKKILKMAFYDKNAIKKRKLNITKDKYENLIKKMINNIIAYKNKNGNKINNNNDEKINNEIDKKIIELENNLKELKNTYNIGINKILLLSNENDKNNFIKKLNLTMKRNSVKKIYKEIVTILNNNEINEKYYEKIIDTLKQYEKITETEIKIKPYPNNAKTNYINIIKFFIVFLPLIFALNYFSNNLK